MHDDAANLRAAIERVTISRTTITIQLTDAIAAESRDRALTVRWMAPSPTRRREILQSESAPVASIRPMREKARVGVVEGLRDAHRWLDELMADPRQSVETIAARKGKTERSIRMTLSLAFLAPAIVKAAIEGRLYREASASLGSPMRRWHGRLNGPPSGSRLPLRSERCPVHPEADNPIRHPVR
jgi:site-specific DNA recombinase